METVQSAQKSNINKPKDEGKYDPCFGEMFEDRTENICELDLRLSAFQNS